MTILDLKVYFEYCWKEHIRFKEIKDKIVFFIGTLFITVLFGTGLLIYQSYAHILPTQSEIIEYSMILDKLYTLQYIMMHLFFLLLYLYFTYNNILEKIFLIEAQCAEIKLLEMQGIVGDLISHPSKAKFLNLIQIQNHQTNTPCLHLYRLVLNL